MINLILAPLFFGITLVFIKLSAPKVSPLIGNMLFPATAFVVQLMVFLFLKMRGDKFIVTGRGLLFVGIGGICLGLYTIFLFQAFSQVGVSKASPIIYVGAIILASLFGIIFLKEPFSWVTITGLLLASLGVFLIFYK